MRVGIAEQVFKARGHRSRSRLDQLTYYSGGIHFDGGVEVQLFYDHSLCATDILLLKSNVGILSDYVQIL